MKPRDWDELEKFAGIRRTEPPKPTQRDVRELTRRKLAKSPFWRRRRSRTN